MVPGTGFGAIGVSAIFDKFGSAAALVDGDSSDARCTKPSKKAYSESRNALVIFCTNSFAIGFCVFDRDEEDDDERSTPPAILKAEVVICFWYVRIWERYTVV